MAYLPQNPNDQQNVLGMNQPSTGEAQQQPSDAATSPQNISGGAASVAPSSSPTPQGQQPKQPASSGLFTNIQSYIAANQPNKMGQSVASRLSNQAQGAQGQLKQAQGNFQRQLEGGSLSNRQQAVQDVASAVQKARQINVPQPIAQQQQQAQQQQNQQQPMPQGVETQQQVLQAQPQASTSNISQPVTAEGTQQPPAAASSPDRLGLVGDDAVNRFREVINARYQGPASLRDSGVYNKLANRISQTQSNLDLAKSSQGREELLSRLYGTAENPYTRGMSKLDNLLIAGSKPAQQQIQQAIQGAGNLKQNLERTQLQTIADAQGRTKEIEDINKQARDEFTRQQQEEITATDTRIDNAMKQSQEYYNAMNQFLQTDPNAPVDITPEVASLLGIQGNEGFYRIKDLPKQVLERAKMISANEQARQAALAQMAGLDLQRRLSTAQKYADASIAGTQKTTDIVDTAELQRQLVDAENKFRQFAQGADITGTGTGKAKYSKGMFRGKGTVNAYAEATKNLGDLLKSQGYDLSPVQVGQILDTDPAIRSAMGLPDTATSPDFQIDDTGMTTSQGMLNAAQTSALGSLAGAGAGATAATGFGGASLGAAAGAGAGLGAGLAYLTDADFRSATPGLAQQLGNVGGNIVTLGQDKNNVIGQASGELAKSAADMVDFGVGGVDSLGSLVGLGNIGSSIFGGGKGAAQKKAQTAANKEAIANLRKNLLSSLAEQGFDRRATMLDQGKETESLQGLEAKRQELLARPDQLRRQLDEMSKTAAQRIMGSDVGSSERAYQYNQEVNELMNRIRAAQAEAKSLDPEIAKQQARVDRATKATERTAGIRELLSKIDRTNF